MLWLLIPLLAVLVINQTTRLPRAIVQSAITEYRFFVREKTYPKRLSTTQTVSLLSVWLMTSIIPLTLDQPPLWQAMTLILTAALLTGAMVDYRTGLLPFKISAVIGIAALFYTSINAPFEITTHLVTALGVGAMLSLINALSQRVWRITPLGGGDIALLTALSLCFSLTEIATIIWVASITGLVESRCKRRSMIRFGPHLASATLCCWHLKVIL